MKNNQVIVIKDTKGNTFGIAQTKAQAKRQIRWFLPKENDYVVDVLEVSGEKVYLMKQAIKL